MKFYDASLLYGVPRYEGMETLEKIDDDRWNILYRNGRRLLGIAGA